MLQLAIVHVCYRSMPDRPPTHTPTSTQPLGMDVWADVLRIRPVFHNLLVDLPEGALMCTALVGAKLAKDLGDSPTH